VVAASMTLRQYYRGDFGVMPYQQPGYVPPAPSYNNYNPMQNFWQEERAFQEYQQNINKRSWD